MVAVAVRKSQSFAEGKSGYKLFGIFTIDGCFIDIGAGVAEIKA